MTMKIKNSKLELQKVDNLSDVPSIMKRGDLRYKTIYAIFPKSILFKNYPCISISFRDKNYNLKPEEKTFLENYNEYYVITKGGTKESRMSYTEDEKQVLVSLISGVSAEFKLDTAEILCHALGNREILQSFYSDYGSMNRIRLNCQRLLEDSKIKTVKGLEDQYPYQYQRSRYSVYELVQDLIKDKASICIDYDLTGSYKRVSRGLEKTSKIVKETWNPIIGQSLNKTRANLNLNYLCKVKVEVPENEHGVEPGERELETLKSICLIKDGVVCNTSFGIRIKSKDLVKKLRGAKIIKENLVYEGDYLIDISKMPPISKSKTAVIRSFDLAKAEIWYRLSDMAIEYLRRKQYKESKGIEILPEKIVEEKSEQELYLESLGIYGKYFYPIKKVDDKVSEVYNTNELIPKFRVLPTRDTCTKNITRLLNGAKCNKFVSDFISQTIQPDLDKGVDYETLIKVWESRKAENKQIIRDLKFRLIVGKSMKVCIHGCKRKSLLHTIEYISAFSDYKIPVSWVLKESHVIV